MSKPISFSPYQPSVVIQNLVFRKAKRTDISQIQNLILDNLETNVVNYENGFVQSKYDITKLSTTFVAEIYNEIIAICIIRNLDHNDVDVYNVNIADIESSIYIYSVCVKKEYRSIGVAEALYKEIQELFLMHDLYVDIQHYPHNNIVSRKFHKKQGFNLLGTCIYDGATYGLYKLKYTGGFNGVRINNKIIML